MTPTSINIGNTISKPSWRVRQSSKFELNIFCQPAYFWQIFIFESSIIKLIVQATRLQDILFIVWYFFFAVENQSVGATSAIFSKIFVEALKEFPTVIIQSRNSASTHKYSESNGTSKYAMLLSNFGDKHFMGSVPLRRWDFAINWYLFPWLQYH